MAKNFKINAMTYGNYPTFPDVKKVLVIKLRQLGDVLLTTPVFKVLKEKWPSAQIHAYVYTEAFPLLENNPHIDCFVGYDRKWKKLSFLQRLQKEWALWRQIRKERYDLVINLTEGDRGALAARASKAPIRVGFEPKGRLQKGLYTHIVKHCPTLRHTVERNLDALRRIGLFPRLEQRELFLPLSQNARHKVHLQMPSPFILIHPTSRWKFKCLPVESMRALTEELLAQGRQIVFTAGPDPEEVSMVEEITRGLNVLNLSGKVSLQELGAWIEQSECLICVDSLVFHMASALKKKVIAFFGPTSEVTWGPWRNPHAQVIAQKMSCRPCYQDGCGGSKKSDCLATLPIRLAVEALLENAEV